MHHEISRLEACRKVVRHIDHTEITRLLSKMVEISSVNIRWRKDSGEARFADFLFNEAKDLGLDVELQKVTRRRSNVLARLKGDEGGRTLLLNTHIDTVDSDQRDSLKCTIEDGRLFGRGSCDAKASLTAMLSAMKAVKLSDLKLKGDVLLAAVCDEENRSIGTRRLVERVEADYAVVGEPTSLDVAIAHKGFVWLKILVKGRSAHGSLPDRGIDSIAKMGKIICELDDLSDRLATRRHPLLGSANLHMGRVDGGGEPSVIPALCELVVEFRTLPGQDYSEVKEIVDKIFIDLEKNDPSLRVESSLMLERRAFQQDPRDRIVKIMQRLSRFYTGRESDIIGLPFWTDAALISEGLKIPTIVFGPGSIEVAHSPYEYVDLDEVEASAKIYSSLIVQLCS